MYSVQIVDHATGAETGVDALSRSDALRKVYGPAGLVLTTESRNPVYAIRDGLVLGLAYFR